MPGPFDERWGFLAKWSMLPTGEFEGPVVNPARMEWDDSTPMLWDDDTEMEWDA